MNLQSINQKSDRNLQAATGGLAVRTNLRAGLAWDDLDDQAKALWEKLTNAISSLTANNDTTPPSNA